MFKYLDKIVNDRIDKFLESYFKERLEQRMVKYLENERLERNMSLRDRMKEINKNV